MREIDQALARHYSRATPSAAERPPGRPAATPPAPHIAVESCPGPLPDRPVAFDWPGTVLALERAHSARFEALADTLLRVRDERRLKVLLFTSCHRAEGRTTLVLTLARALARRPGRTLVVDGDLAGPMLARQLGLRPRCGLEDVVELGQALAEAVIEPAGGGPAILPLRGAVARPREFLAGPAWPQLATRLRREFDLVLIDGSPLFTGPSAAILHGSVDAAILVRNRALTGDRSVGRALETLAAGGVPLLGLAETFAG